MDEYAGSLETSWHVSPTAFCSRHLGDRHVCLMANHGALVLGETLEKARWRLENLETLIPKYLFSSIGGTQHIPSNAKIDEVLIAGQP
ncbi:MAG: class II aldolase/adducin family protein [Pseudomonadota bacterium]